MSVLDPPARRSTTPLPPELSPTAKLVFLYLDWHDGADVDVLKEALGVPKLRLYPVLSALERRGLVDRGGDDVTVVR